MTKPQKYAAGGLIVGVLVGALTGVGAKVKSKL
jgi:hypothetical protein